MINFGVSAAWIGLDSAKVKYQMMYKNHGADSSLLWIRGDTVIDTVSIDKAVNMGHPYQFYDSTKTLLIKGKDIKIDLYANLFFDSTDATNGIVKYGKDHAVYLSAGGFPSASNGAWLQLYGETYTDNEGNASLSSGNSGVLNFYSSGAINSHGYHNWYFTEVDTPQIKFDYGSNEVTMRAFNQQEASPSQSLNFVVGNGASEDVKGFSVQPDQIIFRDTVVFLKGFKGDTAGGSSDSVRAAHKADILFHGLTNETIQYFPVPNSDSTLTDSKLYQYGDQLYNGYASVYQSDTAPNVLYSIMNDKATIGNACYYQMNNKNSYMNYYYSGMKMNHTGTTKNKFSLYSISTGSYTALFMSYDDSLHQITFNDSISGGTGVFTWNPVCFRNYRASDSLGIDNYGSYKQGIIKSCSTTDSFTVWKNGELERMSGSTLRTTIGAVSGTGTNYYIPAWTGTTSIAKSSMLNISTAVMNIGSAASFQVINTDTNESSCNIIFNNSDTKYYNGGVNLTYHKIQNDSGYSHFEIRSYSGPSKYLTFFRIEESTGTLSLNRADYDDTRSIQPIMVDNGGLNVDDTIWTGIGVSNYLSMFNSDGAIINSGIIDSGNIFSTPETTIIHNRNWDVNNGYFMVGTITGDSSSYFKMYNKVSGGNTVLRNKNGIGFLTPGSYVVAEDDFHTQYNEEGAAYVNGAKSVRSITAVDSNELKSLDSSQTVKTIPCSLFDGTTYRAVVNASIYRIGKSVTVHIPELTGTITASTLASIRIGPGVPPHNTYNNILEPFVMAVSNSVIKSGYLLYDGLSGGTERFTIYPYVGSYLDAGSGGIRSATFTYICN